jgi:hypothetical protein
MWMTENALQLGWGKEEMQGGLIRGILGLVLCENRFNLSDKTFISIIDI